MSQVASNGSSAVAASNGHSVEREQGFALVRRQETEVFARLVQMALSESHRLVSETYRAMLKRDEAAEPDEEALHEALSCVVTAEHYLRMVLDSRTPF